MYWINLHVFRGVRIWWLDSDNKQYNRCGKCNLDEKPLFNESHKILNLMLKGSFLQSTNTPQSSPYMCRACVGHEYVPDMCLIHVEHGLNVLTRVNLVDSLDTVKLSPDTSLTGWLSYSGRERWRESDPTRYLYTLNPQIPIPNRSLSLRSQIDLVVDLMVVDRRLIDVFVVDLLSRSAMDRRCLAVDRRY